MEEKTFGKKGLIIAAAIIVLLVIIFGLNVLRAVRKDDQSTQKIEVVPVKILPAKTMEIDQVLELTGNIRPQLQVEVSFKIPGKTIKDIFVETGDQIHIGEKIAVLEMDSITAKLDQAKAALDLAKATFEQAQAGLNVMVKDKKRLENLYKEKAVSRQKLDHMEAQVKTAEETKKLTRAQIKQVEATLREIDIALQDHTLMAPISGYVSKRYVDKGSMSSPAVPVVRISKEDILKIVTSVTEKEFMQVKKGMPAEIKVDALPDTVIQGTIDVVGPTINPSTRSGEIEIHIDNTQQRLRAGMFARVTLFLLKKEATMISRDALLKIPGTGGYFIYIEEDGKAIQKNIETGINYGEFIEVSSGILPGDNVIVTGQNLIREGIPVSLE